MALFKSIYIIFLTFFIYISQIPFRSEHTYDEANQNDYCQHESYVYAKFIRISILVERPLQITVPLLKIFPAHIQFASHFFDKFTLFCYLSAYILGVKLYVVHFLNDYV